MDKEIYAQNGVKENDLNTEYTAIFKDKKNNTEIEFKYNAQYDPRLIIDMPFIGEGENANIEFLWQIFNDSPQYLSKYNKMNMNSNNIALPFSSASSAEVILPKAHSKKGSAVCIIHSASSSIYSSG